MVVTFQPCVDWRVDTGGAVCLLIMSSVLYSAVKTLLSLYQSFACFKAIKNEDTEVMIRVLYDINCEIFSV